MNKTLKIALLFATFTLPSFSGFAQDDIYFNPDEEPEVDEVQAEQVAEQSAPNRTVSRHAYDTDTLIAYDDSDYVYSRRLNRFHDADLPVYTNESTDDDGNVNVTNIYVVNDNPYYTYYRPGWGWRWNYYNGFYGYGYYSYYDPWWDGYYYRHSSYWGPGWNHYGYYGYYGYGYPHHYYGGYRPAGPRYYGSKHVTPYHNRHAYSRNNMLGNRSSLQRTNRYSGNDVRGRRGSVNSTSSNNTRSYGAQSRGNINGDTNRSYSGRGSRSSATPSNSTRSYNRGSNSNTSNSTRSYRSSSSNSSNTTRSYSSGSSSSSSSSSSRSYGGDSRGSNRSNNNSSSFSSGSSRGGSYSGGSSRGGGSRGGRR